MVESLAELADLHDDVEIVVVELLHHARVRGAQALFGDLDAVGERR